jgi:hypothetical protein
MLEDLVIVELTSAVAAGADALHKSTTSKPAVSSAAETAVRFPVKDITLFVKAMISVATVSFTVTDNSCLRCDKRLAAPPTQFDVTYEFPTPTKVAIPDSMTPLSTLDGKPPRAKLTVILPISVVTLPPPEFADTDSLSADSNDDTFAMSTTVIDRV